VHYLAGLGASDPLIWTPGAIESLKDEVDSLMRSLGNDSRNARDSGYLSDSVWDSLKDFTYNWTQYRNDVGFFAKLTGATAMRLKDFKEKAIDWRNYLKGIGVTVTGPDPRASDSPFKDITTILKWSAVIAGIGVGALIIYSAMPAIRGIAKRTA
jgi:hypothetical protein